VAAAVVVDDDVAVIATGNPPARWAVSQALYAEPGAAYKDPLTESLMQPHLALWELAWLQELLQCRWGPLQVKEASQPLPCSS
jgi:hypothetical protein